MHPRARILLPLLLSAMASSAQAFSFPNYSFQLDTFGVWKNVEPIAMASPAGLLSAQPIFYDDFATTPPVAPNYTPLGGGGAANYVVFGGVWQAASAGIITLNSYDSQFNAYGTLLQQATLASNVDPSSPMGLKQDSTNFVVGGIFNFTNPGNASGSYGIRFTDADSSNGDDIISLSVHGRTDGQAVVQFSRFDNTTGVRSVLDQQVLVTSHEQIGLGMAYTTYMDIFGLSRKVVYAGYFYLDNDQPLSLHILGVDHDPLFHGETFTRAGFFAADSSPVPVPEPEEYALMLAGLGLVGWAARRRRG